MILYCIPLIITLKDLNNKEREKMNRIECLRFHRDMLLYVCEKGIDDMQMVEKKVSKLQSEIDLIKNMGGKK